MWRVLGPLSLTALLVSTGAAAAESLERIQQLLQQGKISEAQTLLSQSLRVSPDSGGLHNLQGVIKAQQGDYAGAEASFKRAVELDPRLEGAYLNMGRLYQEHVPKDRSARDKAVAIYAALLRIEPGNVEANYQSALLLMQQGKYGLSLERLEALPAEAQERAQALAVRCGDNAGAGEAEKAGEIADRLLLARDLMEADVVSILPVLTRQKDSALAIQLLEGLRARHLASFDALHALGILYKEAGRHSEERQVLEQAAQLKPNSVPLLLELAQAAYAQKDYTGALGYLAHARDLAPNNASIHFFWGMVCVEQDLAEEAYQALKKAVTLAPDNPYYNYAMGVVTMQRQDAREALPYLQKYCEMKPHDARGRLALGVAYFNSHDEDQAEKVLAPLVTSPDTKATAEYYLGRIADKMGNDAQAVRHLEAALQTQPDYADAYAELGLVRLKQRDYARAEEAMQKALKLNPDSYMANLNLLMLYRRTKNPKVDEQAKRFGQVREERAQRSKEFLRTIEVRP